MNSNAKGPRFKSNKEIELHASFFLDQKFALAEFSKACQRELESLGLSLPVASRLEVMSTSSHIARSSAASRVTPGVTPAGSGVRGSFFRQRSVSGGNKSSAHASVLVMELNESSSRPQKPGKIQAHSVTA